MEGGLFPLCRILWTSRQLCAVLPVPHYSGEHQTPSSLRVKGDKDALKKAQDVIGVLRTGAEQRQQSVDGALQALASQRCSVLQSPYSGDSLRRTLTSSPHTTRTGRAQHRLAKASVPEQQNQDASRRKQQTHDIYATSSGLAFSDSKSTYESRARFVLSGAVRVPDKTVAL